MNSKQNFGPKSSSVELARKRATAARIIFISICLALLTAAVALPSGFFASVSAAIQQAAKRTVTPTVKPPAGVRVSKPAQIVSQGKINLDGSITAGKMVTDAPILRTTDEIMADQASRPSKGEA